MNVIGLHRNFQISGRPDNIVTKYGWSFENNLFQEFFEQNLRISLLRWVLNS